MKLKRTLLAYVGAFAIALTGCGSEPQAPLKNPENGTESVNTDNGAGTTDTDTGTGGSTGNNTSPDNGNTDNTDTGNTDTGNTDTGSSGSDNTGNDTPSTGGIDNTSGSCEPTPFAFTEIKGFASATNQVAKTYATNVNADNSTDFVIVESYQGAQYNGPTAPGTYELDGSNYADCGLCVLVYKGCVEASGAMQCQQYFFAEQGTVQINAIGGAGSEFDIELLNMNLVEVTIDSTYTSTPVAGGENWCVHGYNWATVLDDGDAQDGTTGGSTGSTDNTGTVGECSAPENGTGTGMGDQIGNFTLTNCNGDSVSLHDSCGSSRILWLIGSATWCGYCPQQIAEARQAQQQVGADNLAFYVVADDVTSQSGCYNYAQSEGVDPSQMLYATQSSAAMNAVLNRVSGIGQGFPMNVIMNGSTMELLYAGDGYTQGLGDQVVESLNQ